MNDRQRYALTHPLSSAVDGSLEALTVDELQRDGNLLRSILAVDR